MLRRQDLAVLMFYYLGYSKIKNRILRHKRISGARFIVFHNIELKSSKIFKKNLIFLKKNTNVISLDDFLSNRMGPEEVNVVISFDDGYKSWMEIAIPELKRLGMHATFFISSGSINLSKEKQDEFKFKRLRIKEDNHKNSVMCLEVDDLKRIIDYGFSIGGHTVNHLNLSQIKEEYVAINEIAKDKSLIEKTIGEKIYYFSYPFGAYFNERINLKNILIKSGYKAAVVNTPGLNYFSSDRYLLNREIVFDSMNKNVFRSRILGNYDAISYLKEVIPMSLQVRMKVGSYKKYQG